MKQNLETLKKILDENAVWLEMPMTRKVIQWKSDFEKELRSDLIQDIRGLSEGNKCFIRGFQFALNEVLGVESKVKEEIKNE